MTELALIILAFTALHVVPSTSLRARIIDRFGRGMFMTGLSVASVVLFAWLWVAYFRALGQIETVFWITGFHERVASAAVMLMVFYLAVLMVTQRPMVIISGEHILSDPAKIRGVLRITRHPLMWVLGLWAIIHLFNNADPAGFLLFGYFVLLALGGTFVIDRRRARLMGADWQRLKAQTSNIPFMAIATGRNRCVWSECGGWRLILAIALWAAMLHFHGDLIGTPIF